MNDIEVGDIVAVVDDGQCYSTYNGWAQQHGLSKFINWYSATKGFTYQVVAKGLHKVEEEWVLLGIEDLNTKQQYIIGIEGVRLVSKKQPKTFDEFVKDCIKNNKGFKVRVTPETSKLVQETVFKYGGGWCRGREELKFLNEPFLYLAGSELSYSHWCEETYFNSHCSQEITVTPVTTLEYQLVKVKTKEELEKEERLKKIKELEEKLEELRKLGEE